MINKFNEIFGRILSLDEVIEKFNPKEPKDHRYNEPKGKHKATEEQIDEAIESTEIYKRSKEYILNAQRGQIGYGLDKYPETLNPDTWSMIETMNHIVEESVDKIHYEVMMLIKLERQAEKELKEFREQNTTYLDGVPIGALSDEQSVFPGYSMADIEATQKVYADNVKFGSLGETIGKRLSVSVSEALDLSEPTISFNGKDGIEILKLKGNGDILVKGELVENDKEVVDGLRYFLINHGIS